MILGGRYFPLMPGDLSELSRADCPYMPMDLLTLSDLGLPALGQNGLNDELNVGEWICAHIVIHFRGSWVRKKDGKLKNTTILGRCWRITHFDLPIHTSTAAVTLFLTTWKEQQQGQSSTTLKQPNSCKQKFFCYQGLRPLHSQTPPAELMKILRPLPQVAWHWPKLGVFCM